MNDQSTNNNANSLNDLFTTGEEVTTNQVSSTDTVNQSSSIASQSSQIFTNQATSENMTNQQSVISQNNVGMTGVTQQVMPDQGVTTQIPSANVGTQQSVINQNGTEINEGSHQAIPNQEVVTNQTSNNILNQNVPNSMDDESLLRCFIGENYNKITKRKFNFAACFFGSFYLFYRKMFWQGLVLYCITLGIITLFGSSSWLVLLAIAVFWGLAFNSSYVKYAKDEIERIKQENSDANPNIINFLCVSKGGTSTGNIFLGIFISGIISTIYGMIVVSGIMSTM